MSLHNEPLEKIVGVLAKEKQAMHQRLLELEMSRATHRVVISNSREDMTNGTPKG